MRRTGPVVIAVALLLGTSSASAEVRSAGASTGRAPATRNDTGLQRRLAKALRVPHVATSRSAAVAVDLTTGQVLYTLNGSLPLAPASNEKLALTFALLKTFSPDLRIETKVLSAGTLDGDTLDGSLALVGGGDPTLSSADLEVLARRVRAAGIRHVTGGVIGDESLFDAKRTCAGWKPSFYMSESPPLSALVVDRARFGNYIARRPALAAALLFRDALRAAGVSVDGGVAARRAPVDSDPVTRTFSEPLRNMLAFMDLHSDNFTAEELLKFLSLAKAEVGSSAAGAQVVTSALAAAQIPTAGVRIVDGSGLSQSDRLTTDALVKILQAIQADATLGPVVLRALPVAGVSGTLKDRMRTPLLVGHVVAKTGTTDIASSLSGYVNSHFAFAIIQNGHPLAYWWAREAQDRFATVLAKLAPD